jgi:putative Holliday junction resolvase
MAPSAGPGQACDLAPGGGGGPALIAMPVTDPKSRPPRRAGERGRACALDPGSVRVGVAIDDELGLLAHPRGTLDPRDRKAFIAALRALVDDEGVTRFVVGLPLHMHGEEGPAARGARELAQLVADTTGRTVELWDERLSTVQAQRALTASELRGAKARARIDEAAACAILQSWLDAARGRGAR